MLLLIIENKRRGNSHSFKIDRSLERKVEILNLVYRILYFFVLKRKQEEKESYFFKKKIDRSLKRKVKILNLGYRILYFFVLKRK